MLPALIWKDFCLVRLILGISLAVAFAAVPFNIAMFLIFSSNLRPELSWMHIVTGSFEGATAFLIIVCYVSAILTAGSIISGERQDRTNEFLAALPPLRTKVLLSKAIIVAGTLAGWILLYAAMLALTLHLQQYVRSNHPPGDVPPTYVLAQIFFGAAGIAWAASSFCRTITPPVLMGIIIPGLLVTLLQAILYKSQVELTPEQITQWVIFAIFVLGLIGFATGTIIYLTRRD